jgi:probable rRNA maturation factor
MKPPLPNCLLLRNRQRAHRVDTRQLRRSTLRLLETELRLSGYELGIHLVGAAEMTRVNETYLNHEGPTDVITFDHSGGDAGENSLHGELFICVEVAIAQAREFRTDWQEELARYVVHGVLHLLGHDDLKPAARRVMKREENRLLRALTRKKITTRSIGAKSQ